MIRPGQAEGPLFRNFDTLVGHGEKSLRKVALEIAEGAVRALAPDAGVRRCVSLDGSTLDVAGRKYDLDSFDRIVLLGAGKATRALAEALADLLGPWLDSGLVVLRSAGGMGIDRVSVLEAGHPIPTAESFAAGRAMLELAGSLGEGDLALCAMTGGSSALAALPPPGVSEADKTELHRLLVSSGLPVTDMNVVRKHVSAIKGGRLARAIHPAQIINVSVSDVVGDPLDCITDPTVQDTSSVEDAVGVLTEYDLLTRIPPSIRTYLLESPAAESPDLGDVDIESVLVTRGVDGADAAVAAAEARGFAAVRLGDRLEGEAWTVGGVLATLAREAGEDGIWPSGSVIVGCGGESTVRLGQDGARLFSHGGPSQEAAVSAAAVLQGARGVVAFFMDTDGSDGGTEVAGGIVDWSTAERARAAGISLRRCLVEHSTLLALEKLEDALVTGPTETNANDLVVLVVR